MMQFHSNNVVDITPNKFTSNYFENGQEFVWRFDGLHHSNLGDSKYGNAIKINNFPKELITRSSNWGWIAQNPYVIYASFPIPDPETEQYESMLINYFYHEASSLQEESTETVNADVHGHRERL